MRALLTIAILITLSGCTSMKYNGSSVTKTEISYPPLNIEVTKNLGDQLLEKGFNTTQKALIVEEEMESFAYDIPSKQYKQTGYDDKGFYFEPWGIIKAAIADPFSGLTVQHKNPDEVCVITVFNASSCIKGKFRIDDVESIESPSYSQTLIYTGKVGNKVRFAYREFSNSMARPAFSTEVEYDLDDSNVLGYQNAKIEVISATNTTITYKVLSNF
jgi:hypothetical protein